MLALGQVLLQVLLIVHVACAATWFGSTLFIGRRLRNATEFDARARLVCHKQLARESRVFTAASTLVFLTGLGMALQIGFSHLSPRYHAALLLTLIWVGLDHGIVRRSLKALATVEPLDSPKKLRKLLAGTLGVQHLLFSVSLVLMLWKL
jgi:putative copper export protein